MTRRRLGIAGLVALAGVALAGVARAGTAAGAQPADETARAAAGLDSLNARLARAYQRRDPDAYAALYTEAAVFEWPSVPTVRGPAALADMARGNWAALRDMDLRLTVASRRVAADHATEFGAFAQSYRRAAGGPRRTEYGRYVTLAVRGRDDVWRMDRFLGFEDSTRTTPAARAATRPLARP